MSSKPKYRSPNFTDTDIARFWSYVDKTPGLGPKGECWEWTAARAVQGYGRFSYKLETVVAHRVSFLITHGRWPDPQALHHCDHPPCVRPSHLFEGTDKDNAVDAARKQRKAYGSRNGRAMLTDEQVMTAMQDRANGDTYEVIASRYGVALSTIVFICKGTTWKHLSRPSGIVPKARLTETQVRQARVWRRQGRTCRAIAGEYGVHPATIRSACDGKSWKHLPQP